jgi:hypothetical protein
MLGVIALALTACPSTHPRASASATETLGPSGFVKNFAVPSDPSAGLERPLHLPHVGARQRCPITPGAQHRNEFVGGFALGIGPAYPIFGIDRSRDGAYHFGSMVPDNGWWILETNWMVDARDKGALLVRGAPLGDQGQIRFVTTAGTIPQYRQTATGKLPPIELYGQLVFLTGKDVPETAPSGARAFASATAFLGPGCYGFQIDGQTFSRTIVFQVAA